MEYLLILGLGLIFSSIITLGILYSLVAITTYIENKQRKEYFKEHPEEKDVYYCGIIINENDEIETKTEIKSNNIIEELFDKIIKENK